jgi:hypothetical protein
VTLTTSPVPLSRAARSVVRTMTRRCERITDGHCLVFPAVPYVLADGERVVIEPVSVEIATAPASDWSSAMADGSRDDGRLWVTTGRIIVADAHGVRFEWRWEAFGDVRATPDFDGVVLTRRDNDGAVVLIRAVAADSARVSRQAPIRRWLTIEAAYAAATGRLETWLAELPVRAARIAA